MIAAQRTPPPERTERNPHPAAGLGWYHNRDGALAGVPRDAFFGAGAGHELLMVVPSLDLIVVRNGAALEADSGRGNFWGAALEFVFRPAAQMFAAAGFERTAAAESGNRRHQLRAGGLGGVFGDGQRQLADHLGR